MCGIAGIISTDGRDFEPQIVDMLDIVKHRGPDGDGIKGLGEGRVWLGHRRLAIIDLSEAGAQPMSFADGRYWITYNGEIYNYVELHAELEGRGYQFVTDSDTEVVLAAYACWGDACLHRFNGMWSFLIVDQEKGRIFGARDRFGIKPFYYWKSPEGFLAVASEIKQFTVLPGWRAKLNGQAGYDFLVWAMVCHNEDTLFRGVKQLRGGESFEVGLESELEVRPRRWYELTPGEFTGSFQDAASEFRSLLRDSVRLRLRADVAVGSCLSGGLDSSGIVGIATDFLGQDSKAPRLQTFSAVFPGHDIDESRYIDAVKNHCDINTHFVTPDTNDFSNCLKKIIWHHDEPFSTTSIYAGWTVFRLAQGNVKVVLDGQGGDESLAGYNVFLIARLVQILTSGRLVHFSKSLREAAAKRQVSQLLLLKYVIDFVLPSKMAQVARGLFGYNSGLNGLIDVRALGVRPSNRQTDLGTKSKDVITLCLKQLNRTLPALLKYEDRNSMAHSIEARVPFLDYRLVEFAMSLPDDFLLRDWESKRVLRSGLVEELPKAVRERHSKIGFETPENEWFKTGQFRDLLMAAVQRSEILNAHKVLKLHQQIIENKANDFSHLWRIICFENWAEQFGVAM